MRTLHAAPRTRGGRRHKGRALAAAVLAAVALPAGLAPAVAAPAPAPGGIINPGFDAGLEGWKTTGNPRSTVVGSDAGGTHLTQRLAEDGTATARQKTGALAPGWWTVSARVKSEGSLGASRIGLRNCGTDGETVIPSTAQDGAWLTIAADAYVTKGSCEVVIETRGTAGDWVVVDDVTLAPGSVSRTVRGADLSNLLKNEDNGAAYFDAAGRPADAVQAFADAGATMVRLKVWVDPADGYNTTDQVVATAKRAKAAGMEVLVDFHYSDRWTDPGAQGMPAAWVGLGPEAVADALYQHTHEVLTALKDAGATADAVQVGNEINPGMLWPLGQTWDVVPGDGVDGAQWDNLAMFLSAGSRAVKDVSADTDVILHLTNINNGIGGLTWWFDEITARNVQFDTIGLSYYGYWHGSMADLQNAITTLSSRYDRDVLVVENSYPFTLADNTVDPWENVIDLESELVPGYPATPEGQAANFRAVQDVVASAPGGRGIGVVSWEPAWTAVEGNGWDPADPASGNAWENQAMFDFQGRALPALAEYAPDAEPRIK
ncbi:arabinogalactan endo-1,4-beta-galactosidase [Arthrobacter sp. NamB2]|uniref:glycoside hydrolase family 53 protein n=1 Tax=Arthrobacter sp. NamB2 TaxID=2576035 RepID=UPI0010C97C55|nr:glycosyl hydrolase 53 family protein [Arthrobacter sp. NamB2]TKV27280.1 arabinogalactan endo-1,4-beta-galactosidase [Arthrobacter sp. NamB2]